MQYCSLLNHSQVYRIQRGKVLQGENQRPLEYPDPEGLILLRNQSQSRARAALRPAASRLARRLWERGLQIWEFCRVLCIMCIWLFGKMVTKRSLCGSSAQAATCMALGCAKQLPFRVPHVPVGSHQQGAPWTRSSPEFPQRCSY